MADDERLVLSEDERLVLLEDRCPRHNALLDHQRRCLYCATERQPFDWSATAAEAAAKFDRWAHFKWARRRIRD